MWDRTMTTGYHTHDATIITGELWHRPLQIVQFVWSAEDNLRITIGFRKSVCCESIMFSFCHGVFVSTYENDSRSAEFPLFKNYTFLAGE